MRPGRPFPFLPLLAGALALVAAPSAPAQAGLSGNALGGQMEELRGANSGWDKGLQSRSALGQLEELTGAKVDRSSTTTSRVQQSVVSKPKLSSHQQFNRAMNAALADAMADILVNALFSDNSAARAKAEAEARAAAEAAAAEAARVAEEARLARIKLAGQLRRSWDAQDQAMATSLSGAFEVRTGTAFFGERADLDPEVAHLLSDVGLPEGSDDTSVVRLPDRPHLGVDPAMLGETTPAVPPVRPGAAGRGELGAGPADPATGYRLPPLTPRNGAEEAALIAAGWYGDKMTGAVKDSLMGIVFKPLTERLERLPGYATAEQFLDFREKYEQLKHPFDTMLERWEDMFTRQSGDAARFLGSGRVADDGLGSACDREVQEFGEQTRRDFHRAAWDEAADKVIDSPEFGPAEADEDPGFSFVRPLNGITKGRYGHISLGP